MRGRARVTRVTCSNSGHSRTPHPLTHSHWQTHCHGNLTTGPTGNLWPMSPVSALSTYLSVPPCLSRPCHVSRSDRARVTLAHVSSLSRGLSSCGLCHVSQCDVVTQCCHDYPLCPCLSVCYHGLSHTDSLLQYRPSVSVLLARPPLPAPPASHTTNTCLTLTRARDNTRDKSEMSHLVHSVDPIMSPACSAPRELMTPV